MNTLKYIILFCCFYCCILACSSSDDHQGTPGISVEQVRTLGGSNNERAEGITGTTDGGYVLFGYTQSADGDIANKTDESFDFWILKFNAANELEWQNTFGGSQNDRGKAIIQTQDGGYALLGSSDSSDGDVSENFGQLDFWLVKLDALGNIQWERSFGFSGNDQGMALMQSNDQGYLITGVLDVTASEGEGNSSRNNQRHAGGDYWALKLDPSGTLEWSRYFGGNFTDTPEGVVQTADGGFIIAGGSDSEDTDISENIGSYDFWVIRISAEGNLVWERSFGGTQIDEARAIIPTNDGNFLILGDTRSSDVMVSSNNGGADVWLIKISPSGNLIWEQNYGGSNFESGRSICPTNGGYLIAGSSRSQDGDVAINKGQNDLWVFKIDSNGGLVWEASVGGSNIDFAYGVATLDNGTIIAVGDTSSGDGDIENNKGFTDLLKIVLK